MPKAVFFIPAVLLLLNECCSSAGTQTTPNCLASLGVFENLVFGELESLQCDATSPRMAVVPYDENAIPNQRKPQRQFTFVGHTLTIPQRWGRYGVAGVVWDSAVVLCEYLTRHPEIVRGKPVLELGSGTGLVGMVTTLIGGEVTLTDRAKPLLHLREAISANLDPAHHHFHVKELDWTHDHSHWTSSFDVILGADIIYIEETFDHLLRTLLHFMGPRTQVYLASMIRYERDTYFLSLLKERVRVSEIHYDAARDIHLYLAEREDRVDNH